MRRNPKIIEIVEELRDQFAPSRSLSQALEGAVDPGLLLARAARDAGRVEVLAAVEAALARLSPIPGATASSPDDHTGPSRATTEVVDYLNNL